MKIASSIYTIEQLKSRIKFIDTAVIMVPHFAYIYDDIDIDEAIKICEENNIDIVLSITRVFMENEVETIKRFIQVYKNYKFLVSDNGLLEYFIESNLQGHLIYDPTTLICNSLDYSFYSSFGFDAVSMSNEIPIADVINCYNKFKAHIFYHVFGRKIMFYSRRKLVSCYKEEKDMSFENVDLSLREATRQFNIPIFENENGTYCFRQYAISLLENMNQLNFLDYAYFESITIDESVFLNVLNIYRKYINNEEKLENSKQNLNNLGVNIEDGFTYLDTTHIKGKTA